MVYQFNMEPKDTSLLADIPATGALPAYLRIAELVSRQIDAGILSDGHRLPPEREMADAHGVPVGEIGHYRIRPPIRPITIGQLADMPFHAVSAE